MKGQLAALVLLVSIKANCQLSDSDSLIYFQQSKQFSKALAVVNRILSKPIGSDSIRRGYLHDKGMILNDLNQLDSSLSCYLKILKVSPDFRPALNEAGAMFAELGDFEKAFSYFLKLRVRDRNDILPLTSIVYYKGIEGNYRDAILYADTTLAIAKDSLSIALTLNNRGYAYLKTGKTRQALSDVEKSLQYCTTNPFAYRNLGLIYIEEKKFREACLALQKVMSLGGTELTKELLAKYCH